MATYKRRWWHSIFFEFYLSIPLLSIQTRLFKETIERMTYDICRVRVKLYRWETEFQLYKRPDGYYRNDLPNEPTKLQRLVKWLTRKRRLNPKARASS